MYANITNPANFQLQDFAQFGFRVITTDFIPVPGEQYRTLYVLQDAVVTATTQKGDDITSKAILAGTLLHGLFNSVSITSGRLLAYAAGRITADEIIALYEAYVVALGGTLENTQCAVDAINEDGVDFFADASLVMIPEGYATGVVYGQRPLTSESQLTFTRASTATRVGPDGAIAVVGSNVPRIDYTGGGCGKLLLEPQRTNLVLYSEQLDNAAWSKVGTTITANNTTSPDGYTNADFLAEAETLTSGNNRFLRQDVGTTANVPYTFSMFIKKNGTRYISMNLSTTTYTGGCTANVDLDSPTSVVTATYGTGATLGGASIVSYGSDWYRITLTATFSAATTLRCQLNISQNSNFTISYNGNVLDGVLLYGAALEQGAYASSYIPTLGSTVTRLAESTALATIPSSTATSFTLFLDFEYLSSSSAAYVIRNAADLISYGFYYYSGKWNVYNGSAFITDFSITSASAKIAIVSTPSTVKVFINGVDNTQAGASPSANLSQKFDFSSGSNSIAALNSFLYFPTALSDADAIALTA